jgi:DNA recombination protein RmuC
MEIFSFVYLLVAFALGSLTGLLIYRSSQHQWMERLKNEHSKLEEEHQVLQSECQEKERIGHQLNSEILIYKERLQNLEKQQSENEKHLKEQFENLANRILKTNSESFSEQQQQKLSLILNPLKEKLQSFERKVEETHKEDIREASSLKEQIKNLQELNNRISKEAQDLTNALLGQSKTRGNWGEVILESILEKSGLVKNQEYLVQQSFQSPDGRRLQPDVIIQLPENKHLVIDSKLSLAAYERFANEDDKQLQDQALREHLGSMRQHIKELGAKNYQQLYGLESLDFVLMFVPVEPAFNAAVSHDQQLYLDAFENNIIIVSHSTLLATLRTIASIWRQEKQNRNALQIADEGGKMYDKLRIFVDTMNDLGNRLRQMDTDYDKAMNQLINGRGNLVGRAEKMRKLGARASKQIEGVNEDESEEDADERAD